VKVAKALGGSFKLVTLAPKTVREMTQLPRETEKDGDTQTNQRNTNEYIKYKPRLNTQKKTHSAQPAQIYCRITLRNGSGQLHSFGPAQLFQFTVM